MKLFCVTSGAYPFEVWCNDIIAECYNSDEYDHNDDKYLPDKEYDTVALHPEILEKLPAGFSKEWLWEQCFFASEEAAIEAFVRKHNKIAENEAAQKNMKFSPITWETLSGRFSVMSIDVPEDRHVKLEKIPEHKCCANCAFDFATEDDGREWHACPICPKAKGSSSYFCKYWVSQSKFTKKGGK